MNLFSLKGKVALVTGASRGIGRHLAIELARWGADLVICSRNRARLQETARQIRRHARKCLIEQVDITEIDAVERMVGRAQGQSGGLDILINNAGINDVRMIVDLGPEDWDRVMSANLRGAVFCARACARLMKEAGGGKILNIASISALYPEKGMAAYAASKAALVQFTRIAALEWAPDNIQVNALCPGYVVTDMSRKFLESKAGAEYIRRFIPLRRSGRPQDLTGAVLFLVSSASDWVTGSTLVVDGGQSVR